MNKWLTRTVGTMGVAGGVVLLAAGVAQAADGTTVGKAQAPTAGVAGLGQMLNPTDLVGGTTGALSGNSPFGLSNPAGALGALPTGSLFGGSDKGHHRKGVKEAGPADAFGRMAGGLTHGVDKGVSKGLPLNGGVPSVGNLPLGMIPAAGDVTSLDSQNVVADLMSVQDVLDQAASAEGLPLPVGGLDSSAGNIVGGVAGAIPAQDLTGSLPVGGLANGLPLVGGLTGGQASAPQAPKPMKPGKSDAPKADAPVATEKKNKPADQPMPLPQPQADPVSGLVSGLPIAGGLAGGPLSTVTGATGGLPVVGGLTKGGLPVLGGQTPAEGKFGMPVATDLLGGLPLVGDLAGTTGKALPGDLVKR
ncbi:hypothetical protein AB0I28_29195 [Phytomonospora sp. NPDC050363]|uniref:hypothetical protein n=1 Tax=Phytomonospora sp. NPDC050363 TaxID=3155642 RepID=UPI00340942D9